jgi:hypothetical protein
MRTLAETSSPPHPPVPCTRAGRLQSPIFIHLFPFVSLCLCASVVKSPSSHLFSPKTPAIPAFPPNSTSPFRQNVDSPLAVSQFKIPNLKCEIGLSLQKNNSVFSSPALSARSLSRPILTVEREVFVVNFPFRRPNVDSTLVASPKFQKKPVNPPKFTFHHSPHSPSLRLSLQKIDFAVSSSELRVLSAFVVKCPLPFCQNVDSTERHIPNSSLRTFHSKKPVNARKCVLYSSVPSLKNVDFSQARRPLSNSKIENLKSKIPSAPFIPERTLPLPNHCALPYNKTTGGPMRINRLFTKVFFITAIWLSVAIRADEGMWLFNDPPRKLLKEKYGFEPSDQWLEHVQKSSVRFNSGGSGSFVSEDGLVLSNHHVGADCLQKLGNKDHDYLRTGFHAKTHDQEMRCLDLELNVLMSMEDVTERVNAAVKPGASADEAFAARRKVMAEIEKESMDKTGLRSDVVTLFQGGKYHLYRYKKYTDVRLVFAPEQQIAFYGGDPDNFEYPRYDLDICFFRVYEKDQPAKIQHYLKWSDHGAAENELVFVSGHPGGTSRLLTMDELAYKRDYQFPFSLDWLHRQEVLLAAWSARSEENARRAKDDLFGIQNSRKAREGGLAGLLDPELGRKKEAEEKRLREAVAHDAKLKDALTAWDKIAEVQKVIRKKAMDFNFLERGFAFESHYFNIARTLVRNAEERPKPNGERLREFRESARESLELQLFSEEPLYDDYEQLKLTDSLTFFASRFGYENPLVQKVLAGKSPQDRAAELVLGTKVKDVAARKDLYKADKNAFSNSKDPIIQLVLMVDEPARAVRKILEAQDEIKRQAYSQIAKAKFAIEGTSTYPDATFTLRLAFGQVKGYEENGKHVPFETTMAGLYERADEHKNKPPFDIPERWLQRKDRLNLNTPFNFVSTADIIGGNSGSPTINKNGEFVGIIFDGNIYSLVLDFSFTDVKARALSVHSSAILEALRKVYDANDVADELTGRKH